MANHRRAIIWFRQDLRLHDNEALVDALAHADEVIPVYVFDERVFKGKTKFGFPKTDKFRAKFIIECVQELRHSLEELGSQLLVRIGKPEEVLFDLVKEHNCSWIYCNRERTQEEVEVQDNLERNLWSIGVEIRFSRGKMLYHTADLPFPVTHTPDVFTQFRKEVERYVPIREPFERPTKIDPPSITSEVGEIPTLPDFGLDDFIPDGRAAIQFKGGEMAALDRLNYYLWESKSIKNYKETRNGLIGSDYSSKFSAWLAQGCLSPKMIYHEIKRFEAECGGNKSTYWMFFELLWRDFFRLMGKKHGNKIFLKGGTKEEAVPGLKNDYRLLELWIEGRTGIPFIDANMREIALTGFMSNRGRQNVASFLVKDLEVNWQMGAEYFESILIDYDVCSNWGNWNYIAGVGSDPREDRYFNIIKQAKNYDPEGRYVKLWLPELAEVGKNKVHRPDLLTTDEQEDSHIKLGADYPKPMINTKRWVR